MASYALIYSLDVGQGMCTYVELIDNDTVVRNALFDLGSTHNASSAGGAALRFLGEQIVKRNPPDGHIDIIFISHKDADHTNLFGDLLKALPKMTIDEVRYGGRYDWYKVKVRGRDEYTNILNDLGARTSWAPYFVKGFSVGDTSWNAEANQFHPPLWSGTGFSANLLCANAPHRNETIGIDESSISERPNGDQANSKSLVIVLNIAGYQCVIGGDATFPTFQFINGKFDRTLLNVYMVLLPHHGSRKTTFGLSATNARLSVEKRQVVDTYAKRMNGATLIASADTSHEHPSLETIDLFLQYADSGLPWWSDSALNSDPPANKGMHYVTSRVDITLSETVTVPKSYTTYQSSQNIYSTLYHYSPTTPQFSYAPFVAPAAVQPSTTAFTVGMNWIYNITPGDPEKVRLAGAPSNRLNDTRTALLAGQSAPQPHARPAAASQVGLQHLPRPHGRPRPAAHAHPHSPRLQAVG
ncbi:hypothetical protein [Aquimonas sp.]|jgi:hypothetical protein|uniref:hypothetical protein n=1 Tax=Aquimonas sp. TaxID=1872588 RepID=UPI0037C05843